MSLQVDIEKRLGNFHLRANFECGSETLGLLGASGCGKSMTLKCIAGIEKPDSGKIILDGEPLFDSERKINLPPQKRRVGYLFQNYALFPNMTVRQNILCGLRWEKNRAEREKILSETMEMLKISELSNHRPSQLSGGQAQRTALARILVNRPKILMLDEPFSALDTHLRLRLQMQLRELLKNFGRGVLMVTHDRNEAYHMCAKIAAMDRGLMFAVKDTKDFFANPETIPGAILSGCKNVARAEKIGDYEVSVPEWGVSFKTDRFIHDGLAGIGIRAHYFNMKTPNNKHRIIFVREMEEPFEWVIEFRFEGQPVESEALCWRFAKDKKPSVFPEELGIARANILLLYSEEKKEMADNG